MVSAGLQMLGIALAVIGWIGVIVVCILPMWHVTAFIGQNIVTAQITWEGIWMSCVVQSTGQMQCKVYDSMLALSSDLQAARALCIISILVGVVGILLAAAGGKCTNCIEDETAKAKVGIISGAIFIVSANTIIRDFYNPILTDAQRREMGASIYIGWGAAALYVGWVTAGFLFVGGAVLCTSCPPERDNYSPRYTLTKSDTHSGYAIQNYV
ncbi:hypothetical protein PO909_002734 [Leuciscus waleckii]